MSARLGDQAPSLWEAFDTWLRRATSVISDSADGLNAINVFPVPDADTGSNLKMTLTGISQAVHNLERASLDSAVQAAILSAHGNSGAIVAEMFVSVCRTLEYDLQTLQALPRGTLIATLLRSAAVAARRAVARPVAGTILTVADEAASAAERAALSHPADGLAVVQAAQFRAQESLAGTPQQLAVLGSAGVVDAGGQAYVLLLDVLAEVLGGPSAQPLTTLRPFPAGMQHEGPRTTIEYEVMYTLRGTPLSDLDALRDQLSELGHSVVIVGDQAIAQVHVHLGEAGAAIETALSLGELSQIRITALPQSLRADRRSVLAVVAGPGLAQAVASLGGIPVLAAEDDVTVDELQAAANRTSSGDLVILPNGIENLKRADSVAAELRRNGRRVGIIPTVAQVQGLAAMAVHEPSADFESVVVAMRNAANNARHGEISVADKSTMTKSGYCQPGDVLGVIQGDVVVIGTSTADVAWQVVERLLTAGGELLTLIRGVDADGNLLPDLAARAREMCHSLDIEILDGGQPGYPLLLGVE
ncbi:MAG TPA: DAK2 domain-containing protein [Propionibacteriaceae bacterium]|nr:DAK2 domain-containing protein [Propionibacteriaceae bacterium]